MVAEPTPTVRPSQSVQEMRHCLMDAKYSSKDIDKLYTCLVILNGKPAKEYRSKYCTKTDAELSAELSQFPCWDEVYVTDWMKSLIPDSIRSQFKAITIALFS